MARPDTSFKVRMDDPLKDRIAEAAKANNRSMNAEIVSRLAKSFEPEFPPMLYRAELVDVAEKEGIEKALQLGANQALEAVFSLIAASRDDPTFLDFVQEHVRRRREAQAKKETPS